MSEVLFLDDDPKRHKQFRSRVPSYTPAVSASECISLLKAQAWDLVSLDHDLEETYQDPASDNCGTAVARWVYFNKPDVRRFVVHSYNGDAARNMVEVLKQAGYRATYEPFKSDAAIHNEQMLHLSDRQQDCF